MSWIKCYSTYVLDAGKFSPADAGIPGFVNLHHVVEVRQLSPGVSEIVLPNYVTRYAPGSPDEVLHSGVKHSYLILPPKERG